MNDQAFQLRFLAKSLVRESKKSEKESKASKNKCKKAMEKGNRDGAAIYAQNAIRQKNEALNLLRLSSRIDATGARVNTAAKTSTLTKAMKGVVKNLDKAMKTMNLESISSTMDSFEKQFEDLDVRAEYMESAMGATTAMTTPEDEVETLMQKVAEENNIEFESNLDAIGVGKTQLPEQQNEIEEDAALEERLKKLQGI